MDQTSKATNTEQLSVEETGEPVNLADLLHWSSFLEYIEDIERMIWPRTLEETGNHELIEFKKKLVKKDHVTEVDQDDNKENINNQGTGST